MANKKVNQFKELIEQVNTSDVSDVSDDEDLHVLRFPEDNPEQDLDDEDRELQAAFAAGTLKSSDFVKRKITDPKPEINHRAELLQKLEDMNQDDLDWLERLDVTVDRDVIIKKVLMDNDDDDEEDAEAAADKDAVLDVHDDYQREKFFRLQAQMAWTKVALPRLIKAKIPTERPEDFFAEMVKTDEHMLKVRTKTLSIKKAKETSERNKRNFELRKYGKKVQQTVVIERQKKKSQMLAEVKKYQKGQTNKMSFLEEAEEEEKSSGRPVAKKTKLAQAKDAVRINSKRKHKNGKFGFGGQKRHQKSNSKSSSEDATGFKRNVHSKKKVAQRPGKARRQKSKAE